MARNRPSRQVRDRAPRDKSATESLLSIALLLESFLFFFLALVLFALRILPPFVALGGGIGLFLITLVLCRVQRYRLAIGLGWALQAVIIATGLLEPLMFLIGAGFAGLWIYCFVTGQRLDRRNAGLRSSGPASPDLTSTDPASTEPKETP